MRARNTINWLLAAALVAAPACADDDGPGDVTDTAADTTSADADATADPDAADTTEPLGPLAVVYPVSPLETPEVEAVELAHLTSEDGRLVGDYARVRSCRRDLETGQEIPMEFGGFSLNLTACTPDHQVFPGDDGTYLHVTPPETPEDDDGRFAEVMMYHHMQVIHDYFKDVHGLTDRDHPLDAVTNLEAYVDLCDEWATLPNAAFIPEESLSQLPIDIDLGVEGDAIVFSGSATKNFSFDASVIYHEYTHAILGATRLQGAFFDGQGINNLPGALNEAYADYFALTIIDGGSEMGRYTLNDLGDFSICGVQLGGGGNQSRDLDNARRCPEDLAAQVHSDSQMFSAALWELRERYGPADADTVILAAVETLTNESGFAIAAEATVDAAAAILGEDEADEVEAIFQARNLMACERVLPIERIGALGPPIAVPGMEIVNASPLGDYLPGYVQFVVDVPEDAVELTLSLSLQEGGGVPGLGGGGDPPDLSLALKPGGDAVRYTFVGAGRGHDAVATVPLDDADAVTLSGDCLSPGPLVFAIHNAGGGTNLTGVDVTSAEAPSGEATFDACGR